MKGKERMEEGEEEEEAWKTVDEWREHCRYPDA